MMSMKVFYIIQVLYTVSVFVAVATTLITVRNWRREALISNDLATQLEAMIFLCREHGDFRNGNTDGTFDEGDVIASSFIRTAREAYFRWQIARGQKPSMRVGL